MTSSRKDRIDRVIAETRSRHGADAAATLATQIDETIFLHHGEMEGSRFEVWIRTMRESLGLAAERGVPKDPRSGPPLCSAK